MMSAIVPGSHNLSNSAHIVDHGDYRQKLQEDLLSAAKMCHARFGGKAELATESDLCVTKLCYVFEQIFNHGLRSNSSEKLSSALRYLNSILSI